MERSLNPRDAKAEPAARRDGAAVGAIVRAASPEALRLLIESGIDVNACDEKGRTAIHRIVSDWDGYFNPAGMIELLIEAGADADVCEDDGFTPLSLAAVNSHLRPSVLGALKPLLSAGVELEDGNGRSVYYCLDSRITTCKWEARLRMNFCSAMLDAFYPGEHGERGSARDKADACLMAAACWGGEPEITAALSRGANVNARARSGFTPLMYASAFNAEEAVRSLIARRANVNAKTFDGNATALLLAARRRGRCSRDVSVPAVIRALAEAGADVNARDRHGMTALLLTAGAGWSDGAIAALVEAGAEVDAKDKYGNTALERAIGKNRLKTAAELLAAGADPREINALSSISYFF